MGGATALIGDPSGKKKEREVVVEGAVKENGGRIEAGLKNVFANHEALFWSDKGGEEPLNKLLYVVAWLSWNYMELYDFNVIVGWSTTTPGTRT